MVQKDNSQPKMQLVAAGTLPVLSQAQAKPLPDNPAERLGLVPAPLMKEVLEAIAAKHGVNLYEGCPYIHLEHDAGGVLFIDCDEKNCITVRECWHCTSDYDSYVPVVFWVSADRLLYPIAADEDYEERVDSVELDEGGTPVQMLDGKLQKYLVVKSQKQAQRMKELRWLEDGKTMSSSKIGM